MDDLLRGLNSSQKKAVLHNNNPLLVLAGAGSGKTRVLTCRIARLVREKVCKPSEILAVTFTNKAAREMRERMSKLVSPKAAEAMTVSTFHSFGVRILREYGEAVGLKPRFAILSDHERVSTVRSIMRQGGKAMKDENHESFLNEISLAKNASLDPDAYAAQDLAKASIGKIYANYRAALMKRQSVDFDDLLLLPLQILRKSSEALEELRQRYRFISIDEFQDTNAVQMKLAILLAAPLNNIMAVGDDDQGIYSWRGACIENILTFHHHFKKCTTVVLDKNYRSTRQILDAAYAVIGRNTKRKVKEITAVAGDGEPIRHFRGDDEEEESNWIAATIKEHEKVQRFRFSDHAILLRTNAMMRRFEEALRREKIPYRTVGALSYFERKEIKDVIAYLRFFANPEDEVCLARMIKVPEKAISKETMEALDDLAGMRKIGLFTAMAHVDEISTLNENQKTKIRDFVLFCNRYRQAFTAGPLAATVRAMLDECGYFALLEKAYREPDGSNERRENVEEILRGLESFEKRRSRKTPDLAHYLQELCLLSEEEDDEPAAKRGVTLMTYHKSKGLEFPVVFLAGLDDAIMPSSRAIAEGGIEEERRLFYVGMTRAQKLLVLTYPATKLFRSKNVKVTPCRFLFEIPEEFLECPFGQKEDAENDEFLSGFFADMQRKLARPGEEGTGTEG